MSITVFRYENVPISDLKQRSESKNPRRGAVDAIAESLNTNGQYSPLVVNESTNEVLVGNHRLLAMKKLGWETCSVGYVDVSPEDADRIVIADNRTADLGSYSPDVLGDILAGLPDIEGTGFNEQDLALILSAQENDPVTTSLLMDVVSPPAITWDHVEAEGSPDVEGEQVESVLPTSPVSPPTSRPSRIIDTLDAISSELEGVLALKESVTFPVVNEWGIPELRSDYLLESIPDDLDTWAGAKVTPDTGGWWLYNYGVDSAAGLPWDRTILSFYTYDHYFENWWRQPAHYTAKVINAGIRSVITPNYSLYTDDPPAVQLWNVYRSRWLGRYFQEAGLKVIPDVDSPDIDSLDWTLLGVPVGCPIVGHQLQTLDRDDVSQHERAMEVLEEIIRRLSPEIVLIYTGPTGQRLIESRKWGTEMVILGNRAMKRRGVAFDVVGNVPGHMAGNADAGD